MDEIMNMSEYQIRFYKEEEYSFAEEQALWNNKKELSDEMLKRIFCAIADDIEDIVKTSEEPYNEFRADTYIDEGELVNFVSYCGDDDKLYFSIFSNFSSIFKWTKPSDSSHLPEMTIKDAFDIVVNDSAYAGVLINACSNHWIIPTEEILNYMETTDTGR
ncbi:MAG: hypothetical protein PHR83_18515 [Paludibacter sp.]|nr:hypothetical protein [Paludibacter sp.]